MSASEVQEPPHGWMFQRHPTFAMPIYQGFKHNQLHKTPFATFPAVNFFTEHVEHLPPA
jgi:hypothetical protein